MNPLIKAAINPPIFRELFSQKLFEFTEVYSYLKTKGFTDTGARTCATSYVGTIKFLAK